MLNGFFKASEKEVTDKFMSSIHKNLEFGNVVVCLDNDHIVAMLNVYCNNQETKEGYICNVEVLKEYRGRHISRHLMKKALDIVSKQNFRSVTLNVDETNAIARYLYDTEGFVLTGNKTIEDNATLLEMRKYICKYLI